MATGVIEVDSTHDLTWLIDIANDMRKAKNDSLLSDLPQSTPQDTDDCLIANAFNYGCSVDPGDGSIAFQTVEDRETYEKIMIQRGYSEVIEYKQIHDKYLEEEKVIHEEWVAANPEYAAGEEWPGDERAHSILPQSLVRVAELFDAGAYDKYTDGYWQSDEAKDLCTLAEEFEIEVEKDTVGNITGVVDLSKVP